MMEASIVILYHGTELESVLSILNHGLDRERLLEKQANRPLQMGSGWYTAEKAEVAWYFATILLETMDQACAVIEMEIFLEHLEMLLEQGLAARSEIQNVHFQAEQIWFHPDAFEFLNQNAVFRPHYGDYTL